MKKLFFTLSLLGFAFLTMAQAANTNLNDSLRREKIALFKKHHRNVISVSNTTTLRSSQTLTVRLDSILTTSDKGPSKTEYSYNSNGKVNVELSLYLENGVWVNGSKTLYTYDSNNRLSEYLIQNWDDINMVWEDNFKEVISRNSNGQILIENDYSWDKVNTTWVNNSKMTYAYNASNQLIADTAYSVMSNPIVYTQKEEYVYDANANLTTKIEYSWDAANNLWKPYLKTTHSYTNNKLSSAIVYYWTGSAWVQDTQETYTYDTFGNPIEYITHTWVNGVWDYGYKNQYTFNTSYLLSNLNILDENKTLYTKTVELSYNNMLTKEVSYDETSSGSGVWTQAGSDTYYYNTTTNAVYNSSVSKLRITTINGKVEISALSQGEDVTIYNLQGIAIYSQKGTAETVSINLPARGLYVVKVGNESIKVVY